MLSIFELLVRNNLFEKNARILKKDFKFIIFDLNFKNYIFRFLMIFVQINVTEENISLSI